MGFDGIQLNIIKVNADWMKQAEEGRLYAHVYKNINMFYSQCYLQCSYAVKWQSTNHYNEKCLHTLTTTS